MASQKPVHEILTDYSKINHLPVWHLLITLPPLREESYTSTQCTQYLHKIMMIALRETSYLVIFL